MAEKIELNPVEQDLTDGIVTQPIVGFPSWTNYFCAAEDTGTWFTEEEDDYAYNAVTIYDKHGNIRGDVRMMYEYLYTKWLDENKPDELWADPPYHHKWWISSVRYDVRGTYHGMPQFYWQHGWIPLEWGSRMHYAKQPDHTILGGFGCSKTTHVGMSAFAWCCSQPRFRFVCAAGFLSNAKPMFEEIRNAIEDTRAERFIARSRGGELRMTESPFPIIRFKNGSQMVFLGADKDIRKVRSESGDWYCVEQSESHSDLGQVTLELGTRTRGRVRGRRRLGRLTFVANSGEAPELWERFDNSETDQTTYFSYNLTSFDNPHLNMDDINRLRRACGDDDDMIDQYMRGLKPVGKFRDFPKEVVSQCESRDLDEQMLAYIEDREVIRDAHLRSVRGVGPVLWSLPKRKDRDYAVYGDPGTKDPPSRGAGVVIVLDETGWPEHPAQLVHFQWTTGGNRIGPWIDDFEWAVTKFDAQARAYYDSTGDQKNIDELSFQDRSLIVEGINMSGIKHGMKLKLLRIMERNMIYWAKGLSPIRQQLARYDEREDKGHSRLPQDIVMTLFLAANELAKRMIDTGETKGTGTVRKMVRGPGGIRRKRTVRSRARR